MRTNRFHPFAKAAALAVSIVITVFASSGSASAFEIQEIRSRSGLVAWLVEDYSVPVIAMASSFKGGSTQDPLDKQGLSNFLSSLFDEGAGPYDSKAFQRKIEDAGIQYRFSDGLESFSVSMQTLRDNRDEAAELMRLSLHELRFDPDAVRRMRDQVNARLLRQISDPQQQAARQMRSTLYGNHPYSWASTGTTESLAKVKDEDLPAHLKRTFARDNLTIAIVGAVSAQEAGEMVDTIFAGLPEKADLRPIPEIKPKFGGEVRVGGSPEQTTITLAYPGLNREDPDYFAYYLMHQILGGGTFSSRLYQSVREERGLAYSVGTSLVGYDRAGILAVTASTRPDREVETLSVIREQIARYIKDGPTDPELEQAKKYVIGSYAINNLDSSGGIANTLLSIQVQGLGRDYLTTREKSINDVTVDDIKRLANRLLTVDPLLVVVGPGNS